ncbi:cytochrome c3 family protein [Acidobacteriota bacterium]
MDGFFRPEPGRSGPNGRRVLFLVMSGIAVIGLLLVSCIAKKNTAVISPEIPGAEYVGNHSCEACHEASVKNFGHSAHARIYVSGADEAGLSGCEACHGPGSKHAEAGGGRGVFIVNPGKSSEACYKCHIGKQAEFNLPFRHPVPEGRMSCSDCHDPHGADTKKPRTLAIARVNDTCAQCHREQTRKHVFEHEALREGCTTCHNVHGSINKKLLVENDISLCLKCHSQIQAEEGDVSVGTRNHGSYFSSGSAVCWNAGCHTGIHGSYVDRHLRY